MLLPGGSAAKPLVHEGWAKQKQIGNVKRQPCNISLKYVFIENNINYIQAIKLNPGIEILKQLK